jgi:hypothetical protein
MNGPELFTLGVGIAFTMVGAIKTLQGFGEQEVSKERDARPLRETEPLSICLDCLTHTNRKCRSCRQLYCGCRGKYCSGCSGEVLIYDEEVVVEAW